MSTLTSTILSSPLLIPGRTKPTNSPNHKVLFHQNDHYMNRIVSQKKRASLGIQVQAQEVEAVVAPAAPVWPIERPIERPKFVLFGSSIVEYGFYEGWAATLAHLYARQVDVVLRGYAGWNSRGALKILDQVFPKNALEQPSLVIVYFGGNDAIKPQPDGSGPHVPLEEYKENMRKIFTHLQNLSEKTRIIFLSNPPVNEEQIYLRKGNPLKWLRDLLFFRLDELMSNSEGDIFPPRERPITNESHRKYSEAGLEVSREFNIKAIDIWSAIQKRHDWKKVSFIDGIHLTNEGSKVLSREILKVLEEAEWEPRLYWKSMHIEFNEFSDPPRGPGGEPLDPYTHRFPLGVDWET